MTVGRNDSEFRARGARLMGSQKVVPSIRKMSVLQVVLDDKFSDLNTIVVKRHRYNEKAVTVEIWLPADSELLPGWENKNKETFENKKLNYTLTCEFKKLPPNVTLDNNSLKKILNTNFWDQVIKMPHFDIGMRIV